MATQVAVIGSGVEHEARAAEVGRLLAARGCTVVTGGLGEVMAAAARFQRTTLRFQTMTRSTLTQCSPGCSST
jgi:predicted Rossmann-fold nucleotide-binding protein